MLISIEEFEDLYRKLTPIEGCSPNINHLLTMKLTKAEDLRLAETMFKIQFAAFCKFGSGAVHDSALRSGLEQIRFKMPKKFSADLEESILNLTKCVEMSESRKKFALFVLNACDGEAVS